MSQTTNSIAQKHKLIEQFYPQLKLIARRRLSGHRQLTLLDVTGLVHEALAKLLSMDATWNDQEHFIAYTASVMRSVVVDYERERHSQKRDGGVMMTLTNIEVFTPDRSIEILRLDQALTRLAAFEPDLVTLVELRCFAGLKVEEIAKELGLSDRTVKRNWQKARAFLKHFFDDVDGDGDAKSTQF
jgi:RNA polymerase sigma factor (TIGR02999 family)